MSPSRTAAGDVATSVILSTFRLNGLLLEAGDRLSADHGLTSARRQVLGAIALADRPLTVPQIARRMGLHAPECARHRGSAASAAARIQPIPNDDHVRSPLVRLTAAGEEAYRVLDRQQTAWVGEVADGINRSDLERALTVLDGLISRLETNRASDRGSARVGAAKEER